MEKNFPGKVKAAHIQRASPTISSRTTYTESKQVSKYNQSFPKIKLNKGEAFMVYTHIQGRSGELFLRDLQQSSI